MHPIISDRERAHTVSPSLEGKNRRENFTALYKGDTLKEALEYRGADKSLARPGRKQATATEDSEFHVSYL